MPSKQLIYQQGELIDIDLMSELEISQLEHRQICADYCEFVMQRKKCSSGLKSLNFALSNLGKLFLF